MKKLTLTLSLFASTFAFSQIGINTTNPNATLDVNSSAKNNKVIDGIIAPKLTGDELRLKNNLYKEPQQGAIVYVTVKDSQPKGKTVNVTEEGYYYFDGKIWQALKNSNQNNSSDNIYNTSGTLTENRIVTQNDKTLKFTGNQVNGFNVGANSLSVDMKNNRIGVNNSSPTHSSDIDGLLRIKNVPLSDNSDEYKLVVDSNGVVKKALVSDKTLNLYGGYLTSDFTCPPSNAGICTITNITQIGKTSDSFDSSTGVFSVKKSGVYKIIMTVTLTDYGKDRGNNYVIGIMNSLGMWINRSSLVRMDSGITGRTYTYINSLNLVAGSKIRFGVSGGVRILANPYGTTGSGRGTYFSIEYLSSDTN